MLPKTEPHVWPGLYHVVMGLWVMGLTGGSPLSKLKTPGEVSCRSLPHPWPCSNQHSPPVGEEGSAAHSPVNSCSPTCTSNDASRYF